MLIEALLAIIALITVARLGNTEYSQALKDQGPINVFANGIGVCLNAVKILPEHGIIFATLAVSAFALTSLDTATRLSRFCLQELFTRKKADGSRKTSIDRYTATVISAGAGNNDKKHRKHWPEFFIRKPCKKGHFNFRLSNKCSDKRRANKSIQ